MAISLQNIMNAKDVFKHGSSCGWKLHIENVVKSCPARFFKHNAFPELGLDLEKITNATTLHWKCRKPDTKINQLLTISSIITSLWISGHTKSAVVGWLLSSAVYKTKH